MSEDNLGSWALIDGETVVNVIVYDGVSEFPAPEGLQLVEIPFHQDEDGEMRKLATIGWTYRNGEFIDERPEPE